MHAASKAIYALKPVSFRYHRQYDRTQTIAFGLIAEEVAEVYHGLVGRNHKGEPESVRYEQINAMLLNEFLEEHRKGEEQDCKIQEQETTIVELRSEIRSLAATLNEQASELRKVSAQLQVTPLRKRLRRIRELRCVLAVLAAANASAKSTNKRRYPRCSRNRREWNANGRGCPIRSD